VELFLAETPQSHSVSFAPPEDEETQFVVAEKTSSFMALNDLINQPEASPTPERDAALPAAENIFNRLYRENERKLLEL
jgi:hypothetical protein